MNETLSNKLKRNVVLDYFCTFITNLNMQSCIWVLYLGFCGLSLGQIGLLEGIYHITSMIFEVPSGAIADLLGRKRSMLVSKFCIAVSCLIMLYSRNFWLFGLSFFIQAIGNNFNSGSEEALIYDSMKAVGEEEKYIGVNGKLNVIIEVSQSIAVVIGGILAEYSFFWCYGVSLIIALLAFVPVLAMTEAPFEREEKKTENMLVMLKNHFGASLGILREDPRIGRIVIFFAGIFASHTLLYFYSQQYFFDLGYNKIQISLFMLIYSVFCCVGAYFSDKIFERFGKKIGVLVAFAMAVAIACFVFENVVLSVVMISIAGFCNSLLYPIQSGMLNSLIPSEQRATLISVNSMFFSVAMIIIFPVVGFVSDQIGLGRSFLGIGFVLLGFTLLWCGKMVE